MNYKLTATFACVLCAFVYTSAAAQDQLVSPHLATIRNYLPEITSVYGDTWVANNPEGVAALENCFSNRIKYLVEPLTVNDKYPLLSSFPLMNKNNPLITAINYSQFNPATFVPITYSLPFFSDLTQVIRVDGSDYIIVIEPIITQH